MSGSRTLLPTMAGVAQPISLTLNSQIDWISTGRVRAGWAQDNWLIYSTAGLAMMGATPHINRVTDVVTGAALSCASPQVQIAGALEEPRGRTAFGAGLEYGFAPNWSAKAEYLYIAQLQGANLQNLQPVPCWPQLSLRRLSRGVTLAQSRSPPLSNLRPAWAT